MAIHPLMTEHLQDYSIENALLVNIACKLANMIVPITWPLQKLKSEKSLW
jgi:hypothetical protein